MTARAQLRAAAVLLAVTALFHATGFGAAGRWLGGERGRIVQLLWAVPTVHWLATAAVWWLASKRPRALRAILLVTVLPVLVVATGMVVAVGPGHPGVWMLSAASLLALFSLLKAD